MSTYSSLLNELNRDVSKEQPKDVVQFCADWFQAKLRQERAAAGSTPVGPLTRKPPPGTLPAFSLPKGDENLGPAALSPFSEHGPSDSPFGSGRRATIAAGSTLFSQPFAAAASSTPVHPQRDASPYSEEAPNLGPQFGSSFGQQQQQDDSQYEEPIIPSYALGRRTSVSAESLVPANHRPYDPTTNGILTEEDETTPGPAPTPVFPKSEQQLARIRAAIQPNFLFRNLDEEQETDVLAAMKEINIEAGEMIITQGDAGDYFYVVESGKLDVFVKKDGQVLDESKGDSREWGKKVHTCVEGNSFGELALMHNAPRAASIISLTPCTLWALDRVSFRTILLDHTSRKRRLYESFLSTVSILASLQPHERAKIADVLESRTFTPGQAVIAEGDAGEEFFLVEGGSAVAVKRNERGEEVVVKQYGPGDYFGELALINRQNRLATVRASGQGQLRVAALGEQAFTRLLGPVKDIMARSVGERYGLAAGR